MSPFNSTSFQNNQGNNPGKPKKKNNRGKGKNKRNKNNDNKVSMDDKTTSHSEGGSDVQNASSNVPAPTSTEMKDTADITGVVTEKAPLVIDSATWSGYSPPSLEKGLGVGVEVQCGDASTKKSSDYASSGDVSARDDEKSEASPSDEKPKLYWPRADADSSRTFSLPTREESGIKMLGRSPKGKKPSHPSAHLKNNNLDKDEKNQAKPISTATSITDDGSPVRRGRTRSLEDLREERNCLAWVDFSEYIRPRETESVDSVGETSTTTRSTVSQSTRTLSPIQELDDSSEKEDSGSSITQTIEISDTQSDTDSDKTATPTTVDIRPMEENVTEHCPDLLREYLLGIFKLGHLADSEITLKSFNDSFPPIVFRTHKLIIARSPLISCILNTEEFPDGRPQVNATAGQSFTMIKAFEVAIQSLYGFPVLDGGQLRQATLEAIGHTEKSARRNPDIIQKACVDFAMCYAASGAFFGNYEVLEAGVRIVEDLIDWETVELVLQFGMTVDNFLVAHFDKIPFPEEVGEAEQQITVAAIKDLRETWAPRLISSALEWLCNYLYPGVMLLPKAQVTCMNDRIPYHLRYLQGSVIGKPNLARVMFGWSPNNRQKPTRELAIMSAILVSMPFENLKEMFSRLEARNILTINLANCILEERELRRFRALEAYAERKKQSQDEKEQPEIKELGYKEFLVCNEGLTDDQDGDTPIEATVERVWVGLELKAYFRSTQLIGRHNRATSHCRS